MLNAKKLIDEAVKGTRGYLKEGVRVTKRRGRSSDSSEWDSVPDLVWEVSGLPYDKELDIKFAWFDRQEDSELRLFVGDSSGRSDPGDPPVDNVRKAGVLVKKAVNAINRAAATSNPSDPDDMETILYDAINSVPGWTMDESIGHWPSGF